MDTVGFVGTVEVETVNASRLWFSLTANKDQGDWIKIGPVRRAQSLHSLMKRPIY